MEQLSQSFSDMAIASPTAGAVSPFNFPFNLSFDLSNGLIASALASLGTGFGALPILFTSQLNERWKALLLSIGSGVMLSAAAFSLLLPAWNLSQQSVSGAVPLALAMILGAGLFYGLEKLMPEANPLEAEPWTDGSEQDRARTRRSLGLFVLAIALHHLPEGLAVGVGTATTQDPAIAIGIALQNLPEGLMVALALRELGSSLGVALLLATVSGWLEPIGGWLGVSLAGWSATVAPLSMALAAGAMLFVVLHELLPEIDLKRLNSSGALGLITGLVVMGLVEQVVG